MIEVENLTRKYGDFTAVQDVSFSIQHGEVIGLLGHNGAGKTTIMKVITGYLEPTEGTVRVDGINVLHDRIAVQQKIGYLPENCPVYPDMNVVEYLEYAAELRSIPKEKQATAIREAIERTKLHEKTSSLISTLSRGYRQRVGVAQAILHQPQILILDEPTNGLDPAQIEEMRSLIRTLSENATVILSTHIMQEVHAVCDRVLIMSRGKLAVDSKLSELEKSERVAITVDKDEAIVSDLLKPVPGIRSLTATTPANGHKSFYLDIAESSDAVVPEIAKTLVQGGCNVYAIHPELRNLETVFLEVTAKG